MLTPKDILQIREVLLQDVRKIIQEETRKIIQEETKMIVQEETRKIIREETQKIVQEEVKELKEDNLTFKKEFKSIKRSIRTIRKDLNVTITMFDREISDSKNRITTLEKKYHIVSLRN